MIQDSLRTFCRNLADNVYSLEDAFLVTFVTESFFLRVIRRGVASGLLFIFQVNFGKMLTDLFLFELGGV